MSTSSLHPFEQLIYDRIIECVTGWTSDHCKETYALCLLYSDYWAADAAGREFAVQSTIDLWHNTEAQYSEYKDKSSTVGEARWSAAYWLRDTYVCFPQGVEYGQDPPDAELHVRNDYCSAVGLEPDGADDSGRATYGGQYLWGVTRSACRNAVARLHADGIIVRHFGRPIPVIITEHEPSKDDVDATRRANPAGLSREAEEEMQGFTYTQIDAYQELRDRIHAKSPMDQATFWLEALQDFELDRQSETRTLLAGMNRTLYNAIDELTNVGEAAVTASLPVIEQYGLDVWQVTNTAIPGVGTLSKDQWMDEMLRQFKAKSLTPAYNIVANLLTVIFTVGIASESEIDRLETLGRRLYYNNRQEGVVNPNLRLVFGALHRLQPDRFPEPRIGNADNKLLNAAEFGLGE